MDEETNGTDLKHTGNAKASKAAQRVDGDCSPVECDTCHHWEWNDGKHGFMSGYCPIFSKVTHKDDGTKCTSWQKIHLEK